MNSKSPPPQLNPFPTMHICISDMQSEYSSAPPPSSVPLFLGANVPMDSSLCQCQQPMRCKCASACQCVPVRAIRSLFSFFQFFIFFSGFPPSGISDNNGQTAQHHIIAHDRRPISRTHRTETADSWCSVAPIGTPPPGLRLSVYIHSVYCLPPPQFPDSSFNSKSN